MAKNRTTSPPFIAITRLFFIFFLLAVPSTLACSSPRPVPISDEEIATKKGGCYADIENGLWGGKCRSSKIAKKNCALRCLSSECYELIYESDPLEEGERDYIRRQEYRYCMRRLSVGLGLEGVKGAFDVETYVRTPSMSLPGAMKVTFRR